MRFGKSGIQMREMYEKIYEAVKQIPSGKVATYGQIAALAGNPKAARVVGNALHVNPEPDKIPCFRVVNAHGRLTGAFAFGGIYIQKNLLDEDGVEVVNFKVDLKEYQWQLGVVNKDFLKK